jgi:hypothetical protein
MSSFKKIFFFCLCVFYFAYCHDYFYLAFHYSFTFWEHKQNQAQITNTTFLFWVKKKGNFFFLIFCSCEQILHICSIHEQKCLDGKIVFERFMHGFWLGLVHFESNKVVFLIRVSSLYVDRIASHCNFLFLCFLKKKSITNKNKNVRFVWYFWGKCHLGPQTHTKTHC